MAILSRRAGLVFLALCTAGAVASCSVPVPDAGKFGGGDGAVDVEAADSPDLVGDGDGEVSDGADGDIPDVAADVPGDTELDLEADASPDVAPDSTPDATDVADADTADVAEDTAETAADANLPECITATDCDDANPCTDDTCDTVNGCVYLPNTVTCTDGDACTTATMCKDGTCVGTAVTCDDGNLCTQDSCDKAEGCVFLPNTVTCTDGNACTENDACADGYCKGFGVECDDGNACTDDLCSKATGCTAIANAAPCDDGDACTTGDACASAKCAGGKTLGCDDGIPCTDDGCDAASGCTHVAQAAACDDQNPCTADTCQVDKGCQYAPAAGPCDDGKACTTGEACAAGKCAGGQWTCACAVDADCDDKDPCTTNTCAAGTCQKADAADGTVCDDGNACLAGDACVDGACFGATVVVCDDQNTCTFDVCEPKVGCLNIAHTLACEDGDPCTVSDVCANKTCIAGTAKNCADGNACTDDGCEKGKGCQNTPNTKPCDDDNSCTVGDACKAGACAGAVVSCDDGFACTTDTCNSGAGADPCVYTPKNALCDDKNACTDDSCQVGKGCVNAQNVAPCEDGNVCTKTDVCAEGVCKPGAYVCVCKVDGDCDDKNACTKDTCEGGLKCANAAVADGATCDDGNACLAGEACSAGKCAGGKVVVCDDQNACTADSCEPASGCKHANTTAACNDGDACTVGEACSGGACAGGVAKACDDGNLCTTDGCDKASGCVNAANSVKCDDGDACTTVDSCQEKACVGAVPPDCDDGNACTTDSCGKATGCGHVANGDACDDGDACTTVDSCKAGKCVGAAALKCDDGNGCSDDSCDKASGCVNLANAATCTDGDACTVADACKAKECTPGKVANCDDGNTCTGDSCHPNDGCVKLPLDATCDDGDACTAGESCAAGSCVAGYPLLWSKSLTDANDRDASDVAALADGGAIVAGYVGNVPRLYSLSRFGADGTQKWHRTHGEGMAYAVAVTKTGFALAGLSTADGGSGVAAGRLVATDSDGELLWQKSYGTTGSDYFLDMAALADGGFVLVGNWQAAATQDAWVVRTDGKGNVLWNKQIGGQAKDSATGIAPAAEGGFVVAGYTTSKGAGGMDGWLFRLDADGNTMWDRTFGGSKEDFFNGLVPLAEGGQVLVGGNSSKGAGDRDVWVVRTDGFGDAAWDRVFGGAGKDGGLDAVRTADGDQVKVVGTTVSKGAGGIDVWLLAVDLKAGALQWDATLGAGGDDNGNAIALSPDESLLVAGNLVGSKVAGTLRRVDSWGHASCADSGACMAKAPPECDDADPCTADWCDGAKGCQHSTLPDASPCDDGATCTVLSACTAGTCGGGKPSLYDVTVGAVGAAGYAVAALDEGNAVLGGQEPGADGKLRAWLSLVDAAGDAIWTKQYPSTVEEGVYAVSAAPDGGVLACGQSGANGLTLRVDGKGAEMWKSTVGPIALSVVQARDGGWVVGGIGFVRRLGITGAQQWERQPPPGAAAWWHSVAEAKGGDVVAVGYADGDAPVVRLSAAGQVIWQKNFGVAGVQEALAGVVALADGTFAAAGKASKVWGETYQGWIVRFDAGGSVLSSRMFSPSVSDAFFRVMASPGGLVTAGNGTVDGATHFWLMGTDGFSNTLWSRTFASAATQTWLDFAAMPQGGFALVGRHALDGGRVRLLRTDAWGRVTCTDAGKCMDLALGTCDDKNPLTADLCDGNSGCTHTPLPDGRYCDDGDGCTSADKVSSGKCAGTPSPEPGCKRVLIPSGTFKMGCGSINADCEPTAKPQHDVQLSSYYIDTDEVTTGEYAACVAAAKCSPAQVFKNCNWYAQGRENHPINCVSWNQAVGYCAWAGGRLPTEAEWEKAERGGIWEKTYPWGDFYPPIAGCGNLGGTIVYQSCMSGKFDGYDDGYCYTAPVGEASAANGYGLKDMAGNVREFVSDWYGESYFSTSPLVNPKGPTTGDQRVVRGSSFHDGAIKDLDAAYRESYPPHLDDNPAIGFRCARTYP